MYAFCREKMILQFAACFLASENVSSEREAGDVQVNAVEQPHVVDAERPCFTKSYDD